MWKTIKNSSYQLKILLLGLCFVMTQSTLVGTSYYVLAFSMVALLLIPIRNSVDSTSRWLFAFSVAYCIMLYFNSLNVVHIPKYLFAPIAFYFMGKYLAQQIPNTTNLTEILAVVIFLFAFSTYIALIYDIQAVGLVNPFRSMARISDVEDTSMSATLFGLNVGIGLSLLMPFLTVSSKDRSIWHYFLLASFLLSVLTVIHLVNRTGLVIVAVSFFVVYLYTGKGYKLKWYHYLLLLGIAVYLLNSGNLLNTFTDAYDERMIREGQGSFIEGGNRTWRWVDALGRVFTDPFGWPTDNTYNFVHNFWLDVAKFTGMLPFVLLVVSSYKMAKDSYTLFRIKGYYFHGLMLAITISFFVSAAVEPLMIGLDVTFYLYCFVCGIQRQYIVNNFEIK